VLYRGPMVMKARLRSERVCLGGWILCVCLNLCNYESHVRTYTIVPSSLFTELVASLPSSVSFIELGSRLQLDHQVILFPDCERLLLIPSD
jgi:hypothetical protein